MSRPVPTDRDGRSMVCSVEGCGALGSFGVVGRAARGERTDRRYCRECWAVLFASQRITPLPETVIVETNPGGASRPPWRLL